MKRQNYTKEQNELIAEYCAAYGLEPEQIIFFRDDPKPFFDREATAILLHKLTNAVGIEDFPVSSVFPDNITIQYKVTFEDGSFASSTGMANLNEKIDGEAMSPEQIKSLATARAARSALTNKGIDLVKLHGFGKGHNVTRFSGPPETEHAKLLREVHALGDEVGYIIGSDKDHWNALLIRRYNKTASNKLSVEQLKDLAAFLKSQRPAMQQAA